MSSHNVIQLVMRAYLHMLYNSYHTRHLQLLSTAPAGKTPRSSHGQGSIVRLRKSSEMVRLGPKTIPPCDGASLTLRRPDPLFCIHVQVLGIILASKNDTASFDHMLRQGIYLWSFHSRQNDAQITCTVAHDLIPAYAMSLQ